MSDIEDLNDCIELPDTTNNDDEYETSLQHELDDFLNYESDPDDDDVMVIDEDCVLFENDLDNIEEDFPVDVNFTDPNLVSLFKYGNKTVLHLTAEEEQVIQACTDPVLQRILLQNRLKMAQLRAHHAKIRAVENSFNNILKKESEQKMLAQTEKMPRVLAPKTYIWKLGTPYFKDYFCYGAPPNVDFINKQQSSEYTMPQFSEGRRWVDEDQMMLRNRIEANYYEFCVSQLVQQISNIERQLNNEKEDAINKQDLESTLASLQRELDQLRQEKYKTPPYGCTVGIDWLRIANDDLRGQHTVHECKAMWNIYLHPHISKKNWSLEENEKIKRLAKRHNYQDWDVIAEKLGTNRSGYLVCVHYFTKLCDKFKRERFLPSEDEFLQEVVENCRFGGYIPWATVARYFEDRSKHQLYHRYKYYISCMNFMKKGTFTEAEDTLLTYLVQRFGKEFPKLAEFIPHRTSIQLRNRYTNYLERLTINLGNFTLLDDQKILNYVKKHGDRNWSCLAKEMKRTRAHVRQRHITLKKWLDKNPNLQLHEIPRRKQHFLSQYQSVRQDHMIQVLKMMEDYEDVPTLQTVERLLNRVEQVSKIVEPQHTKWRVTSKKPSFSLADNKLVDFFKGTCKLQRESKILNDDTAKECAERVFKILHVFGMNQNLLCKTKAEENSFLSENELQILSYARRTLASGCGTSSTNTELTLNISHSDPLSLEMPQNLVKNLLPPTVNTLLGLRGLLVKFEMHKEETNESFMSSIRLDSTKTSLEDPILWRMEQNLLRLDKHTRAKVISQRELFFDRFIALFKWPSVMSSYFPEALDKEEEGDNVPEPVIIVPEPEIPIEPPKVGRPSRKMNPKVLKMAAARKRKNGDLETEKSNSDTNKPNSSKKDGTDKPKVKKKGGPKSVKPISTYAVRYLPKRGTRVDNVRKAEGGELVQQPANDLHNSDETSTQISKKIIKISDLKLPTAKVPIINRNVLLKLDKSNNANKILVLGKSLHRIPNPTSKIIEVNSNTASNSKPQTVLNGFIPQKYLPNTSMQNYNIHLNNASSVTLQLTPCTVVKNNTTKKRTQVNNQHSDDISELNQAGTSKELVPNQPKRYKRVQLTPCIIVKNNTTKKRNQVNNQHSDDILELNQAGTSKELVPNQPKRYKGVSKININKHLDKLFSTKQKQIKNPELNNKSIQVEENAEIPQPIAVTSFFDKDIDHDLNMLKGEATNEFEEDYQRLEQYDNIKVETEVNQPQIQRIEDTECIFEEDGDTDCIFEEDTESIFEEEAIEMGNHFDNMEEADIDAEIRKNKTEIKKIT